VLRDLSHSLFVILEKLEYNFSRKMKVFFHGPVSLVFFLFYRDRTFFIFTAIIVHCLDWCFKLIGYEAHCIQ